MPTVIKTVILSPGETFTLPPGASIIYTSSLESLSTTCEDILNASSELYCFRMEWSSNRNQADSPALEQQDTTVESILVNGVTYALNHDDETNVPTLIDAIENAIGTGVLLNLGGGDAGSTSDRYVRYITFQAPQSLGKTVELKLIGPGFSQGLFAKAQEIVC
jgi:hypothetical protein